MNMDIGLVAVGSRFPIAAISVPRGLATHAVQVVPGAEWSVQLFSLMPSILPGKKVHGSLFRLRCSLPVTALCCPHTLFLSLVLTFREMMLCIHYS